MEVKSKKQRSIDHKTVQSNHSSYTGNKHSIHDYPLSLIEYHSRHGKVDSSQRHHIVNSLKALGDLQSREIFYYGKDWKSKTTVQPKEDYTYRPKSQSMQQTQLDLRQYLKH